MVFMKTDYLQFWRMCDQAVMPNQRHSNIPGETPLVGFLSFILIRQLFRVHFFH